MWYFQVLVIIRERIQRGVASKAGFTSFLLGGLYIIFRGMLYRIHRFFFDYGDLSSNI
jgi:hypothetical protein